MGINPHWSPAQLYNNAHLVHQNVQIEDLPASSVLLDSLQTLERELIKRGLLEAPTEGESGIAWFLAETERNVFLWRTGRSIEDRDRFQFWIDIPALIKKRTTQLSHASPDNPFTNGRWSQDEQSIGFGEREYLTRFLDLFGEIGAHAHALSRVAAELRSSCSTDQQTVVLLPLPARRASVEEER